MRPGVPVPWYNSRSGGAGVTGLTSAAGGDALGDNEIVRGDGTTGIQGSDTTLSDAGVFARTGNITFDPSLHVVIDDSSALRFSTVAGAPEILRSAAQVLIRANDGTYTNTNLLTGPVLQQGGVPSAFRGVQIGNTFQVAFSDGVDFNRGIAAGSGNGLKVTDGSTGLGGLLLDGGAAKLLQFGGTTSSFPGLKRNGAGLEVRLADDSTYSTLTLRTGPPALYFGGTGATNAAVRTTAAAVPLVEFVTATESAYANIAAARVTLGGTTVGLFTGAGTPEGAVTAGIGSIFLRTDGGAGTSVYIKESGAGNTGWKTLVGV